MVQCTSSVTAGEPAIVSSIQLSYGTIYISAPLARCSSYAEHADPPTPECLYGSFGDRYSKRDPIGFQVESSEFEMRRALLLLRASEKELERNDIYLCRDDSA